MKIMKIKLKIKIINKIKNNYHFPSIRILYLLMIDP